MIVGAQLYTVKAYCKTLEGLYGEDIIKYLLEYYFEG